MANGTRLRYDGVESALLSELTEGSPLINLTDFLYHDGDSINSRVPSLVGDEYISLTILDANYRLAEIVHLTAYTEGATTGTIERGQEGTSDKTHAAGSKVIHSASVEDFLAVQDHDTDPTAHGTAIQDAADAAAANAIATHVAEPDPHPVYVLKANPVFDSPAVVPDGQSFTFESGSTLLIQEGAQLIVEGDLRIQGTGRLFINGKQLVVSNDAPDPPADNMVWIQTYGI